VQQTTLEPVLLAFIKETGNPHTIKYLYKTIQAITSSRTFNFTPGFLNKNALYYLEQLISIRTIVAI